MSYLEYDDQTPTASQRNFHAVSGDVRGSQAVTGTSAGSPRDSRAAPSFLNDDGGDGTPNNRASSLADNINNMRHRQSLLDGLRGSGMGSGADGNFPPPTIMFKPGSADENASGFTKAFKRLASSWKKRRVIINAAHFLYQDTDNGKEVGKLKIDEISSVKMINRQFMKERGCPENLRDFGWYLVGSGRQYIFACESSETRDLWVGFLNGFLKQRANDEQYLGDDGLTEGRSISFGGGGGGGGSQGNSTPQMKIRLRTSTGPQGMDQQQQDYDPSPETLEAQNAVFDSVVQFKTRQYLNRGGSDDGDLLNDDDQQQQPHHHGENDGYEDDEEREPSSAPSGESEILVERGEEVVAATIEKTREKREALIQLPEPNKAYRRENVVIEALFEDLRTQEPDHVRLAGAETPECGLSYFQPHLLRAAQDGDLPSDLPSRPLLVADYYANADQMWPPLRNDSLLPSSRIKKLVIEMEKMDELQRAPAFRGTHCAVVDADGFVVGGGSSDTVDHSTRGLTSLMDYAKAIQIRQTAASIFSALHDALFPDGVQQDEAELMQLMTSSTTLNATNTTGSPKNKNSTMNDNGSFNVSNNNTNNNNTNNTQKPRAAGVAFPDSPKGGGILKNATFASTVGPQSRTTPGRPNNNNNVNAKATTTPNKKPHADDGQDSFVIVDETKSMKNADAASIGGHGGQRTLGKLFTQSIAALKNLGGSMGGGGGGATREQLQALMNSSESLINQYLPAGARTMLYGRDGTAACPSAHGPVIVIETTKRVVTVTDASYRSDIMKDHGQNKRPPLYMVTTEEIQNGSGGGVGGSPASKGMMKK